MKAEVMSLLCMATAASAFTVHHSVPTVSTKSSRHRSGASGLRMENFGLGVGEDSYANTPALLLGEANYKTAVQQFNPDGLLSRRYPVVSRVAQLKLLSATADAGLLEVLESKGITLSTVEKLLPVIEQYGLLSFAVKNEEFLINFVAPLLVEPAPLVLPLAVSVLKDPGVLNLAAAALVASEIGIAVAGQNVALDVIAGIPLLGGALVLTTIASLLNDISGVLGSIPAPKATPAKSSSAPKVTVSKPAVVVKPKPAASTAAKIPKVSVKIPKAAPTVTIPKAAPATAPSPKPEPAKRSRAPLSAKPPQKKA